jgi:hypothetical protein
MLTPIDKDCSRGLVIDSHTDILTSGREKKSSQQISKVKTDRSSSSDSIARGENKKVFFKKTSSSSLFSSVECASNSDVLDWLESEDVRYTYM